MEETEYMPSMESAKIKKETNMEKYETGTGQTISCHDYHDCKGSPCPIHNPSDHPMKDFPTHWRDDRQIMERICPHGVGHPDPDDLRIRNGEDRGVHGCDGCCSGNYPIKKSDEPMPEPPVSFPNKFPKGQTIKAEEPETIPFTVEAIPTRTMNPDDVLVLKLPAHIKFPKKVMEKFIKIQTDNLKRIFPDQKIIVLTDGIEIEIHPAPDKGYDSVADIPDNDGPEAF